jgi:hypothetical protein
MKTIDVAMVRRNALTVTFQADSWDAAFDRACESWTRSNDPRGFDGQPIWHMFFCDGGATLLHADVTHDLRAVARLRSIADSIKGALREGGR